MLPRNKIIAIFVLLFVLCLCGISSAQDQNAVLRFYQKHISVVDGNRCAMYPSCSSYASRAFEKHGPIIGWIMSCDRLVRCGRDEANISRMVRVNDEEFIYDPVGANDFWWFEKEKNK